MLKTGLETEHEPKKSVSGIASPPEKLEVTTGLWTEGKVYGMFEAKETLLYGEELTLKVSEEHPHSRITVIHYYICNHSSAEKQLKLLALHLSKTFNMDQFSFISPADETIFHLAGEKMFLLGGVPGPSSKWAATVIPSWHVSSDTIWADIGKGILKYFPMAKGNPASILSAAIVIPPGKTVKASSWIISGDSKNELISLKQVHLKNRLAFPNEK
ncbi:hypothetical protein [Bacillus sp. FJAT-27445]|uniref:hypothetical protein n=1 Tax=Bacillus sp. FJAT-27445 TaxID=1679166 RepID=UPI0012E3D19D|nr:hypothetical protein [Bacillus sp. FJAT-27445]